MLDSAESLYEKIKSLSSMPSQNRNEYNYRMAIIALVHDLFAMDWEFAIEKKAHDLMWNLQKELINHIKPTTSSEIGKANYINVLHTCFGEINETLMLVEHSCGHAGLFTSLNQEKIDIALSELPRRSSFRHYAGGAVLHMGDILRYLHEDQLSEKYYLLSTCIHPEKGQSWNQLGVLRENLKKDASADKSRYVNKYELFDSIYYYYRAAFSPEIFSAERNISRILLKILKEFTQEPPLQPDLEEFFLVLLANIVSDKSINNENALFDGFRQVLRSKALDLGAENFMKILIMLIGTYEKMIKNTKNVRTINRLFAEVYETLAGLLLNTWDTSYIYLYYLYLTSMVNCSFKFEENPEVESSIRCVIQIMNIPSIKEIFFGQEMQVNPFQDYFLDCFVPLGHEPTYEDLNYENVYSFLKGLVDPATNRSKPSSELPDAEIPEDDG